MRANGGRIVGFGQMNPSLPDAVNEISRMAAGLRGLAARRRLLRAVRLYPPAWRRGLATAAEQWLERASAAA